MNNEFSKIKLPSGTYNVKDTTARNSASAAQTTANAAKTTANNANTTANNALTKATQNESDINTLEGKVGGNTTNITALTSRVTQNETDIEGLQTQVGDINNWSITFAEETITFTEG